MNPLVILGLAFAVLVLGMLAAFTLYRAHLAAVDRLVVVGERTEEERAPWASGVDKVLAPTTFGQRLGNRLAGAGLSFTAGQFLVIVLAIMAVVAVVGVNLVGRVSTVVFVLAVPLIADRFLLNRVASRTDRFVAQLPEVARVLANASSAGLSVQRGIAMAAAEMSEPAASELKVVDGQLRVGRSMDFALDDLARRLPSRELNVLVRTLAIQARSGGALVRALQNIARSLEERRQLLREAKTASTGAMFSGYVVIFLGVGTLILANVMWPGVIDRLATHPLGIAALVASLVLYVLGYVLMRMFTKVTI